MTTTTVGPYEHTGAYRPDVIAQIEGTEPQWSDAPAGTPAPDLSGIQLPSLRDFAWRLADQISADAYGTNAGSALGLAAIHISLNVRETRPPYAGDTGALRYLDTREWRDSLDAWQLLREIRVTQLGGRDALQQFREEQS